MANAASRTAIVATAKSASIQSKIRQANLPRPSARGCVRVAPPATANGANAYRFRRSRPPQAAAAHKRGVLDAFHARGVLGHAGEHRGLRRGDVGWWRWEAVWWSFFERVDRCWGWVGGPNDDGWLVRGRDVSGR